jgi:hypothetical protein
MVTILGHQGGESFTILGHRGGESFTILGHQGASFWPLLLIISLALLIPIWRTVENGGGAENDDDIGGSCKEVPNVVVVEDQPRAALVQSTAHEQTDVYSGRSKT